MVIIVLIGLDCYVFRCPNFLVGVVLVIYDTLFNYYVIVILALMQ